MILLLVSRAGIPVQAFPVLAFAGGELLATPHSRPALLALFVLKGDQYAR